MTLLIPSFHAGVAAYHLVVLKWMKDHMLPGLDDHDDFTIKTLKKFSPRFLTNWTFTILTFYFILCLFEDILLKFKGTDFQKSSVYKVKNYIFTVLAAPMTMFVTVVFWGVWFIDRELIFPKIVDAVLPVWINHSLHTTTSLFVLIELCISPHQYPKFKSALIGISAYLGVYLLCLFGTYIQSGVWLYPIFKVADWPLKITLVLTLYLLAIGLYLLLQFFTSCRWAEKHKSKPVKKKSKKH